MIYRVFLYALCSAITAIFLTNHPDPVVQTIGDPWKPFLIVERYRKPILISENPERNQETLSFQELDLAGPVVAEPFLTFLSTCQLCLF